MNREDLLLVCLNEECTEVAKEVCKSLRFGLDDFEPNSENSETNRERLKDELTDLFAVAEVLIEEGIIDNFYDDNKIQKKKDKIEKHLLYSKNAKRLE